MNRIAASIKNRLSLRPPQEESLNILSELTDKLVLQKDCDLSVELEKVKTVYPTCTDFERSFPSICFALATGVGKTRLMGAFISYRADRGMEVINELNPVLGLELTATPQVERSGGAIKFRNVIVDEFANNIIEIPRITIQQSNDVKSGFRDFAMDTDNLSYQPVSEEILIKKLREQENNMDIIIGKGGITPDVPERFIVNELMNYPEINYDEQAGLLFKLAGHMVEKFHHFTETIMPTSAIPGKVFCGFRKACHNLYKFDSKTEKDFAIILENEKAVLKWLRPAQRQFHIYWRHNSSQYHPDFVVETADVIYMVETKKEGAIEDADVREKTQAALQYCKYATEFTTQNRGKTWKYVLIPHNAVQINMSFEFLVDTYEKR